MQPTFIKIKFTPLIRHLQKDNTECCLEITPDVSYIENLDKIQWNEKNNFVQYNVPVTYKITLKKDTDKEQDKIYYSCIDLRLLSTKSSLACGDQITKVASDNIELKKNCTDFDENIVLSESLRLNNRKRDGSNKKEIFVGENVIESISLIREINEVCLKPSKKGFQNRSKNHIATFSNQQFVDSLHYNKPVKQICTENTVSKETITELTELKTNQNKNLKLTVTSICTLNTIDASSSEIVYKERINNNSKICVKYNQENRVDYKINHINELFSINTLLYNEYSNSQNKNFKESSERILPDMRVAHFMRTVENEILPLKILLGEIYRKCALLGLFWKSNKLQRPRKCGISQCSEKLNFVNRNRRKPKCNRVVYSVVSEE